jgi:GNAT superfamily N-acetyltransferase
MLGNPSELGVTAPDLAFLTAHVRDTKLLTGVSFDHVPGLVAALRGACVVSRYVEDGRIRGVGVAVDRGLERDVIAVATQPAARGKGVAGRLLTNLVRSHVDARPENRALASVWPGLANAAGVLLATGFETSAGAVRFERGVDAFKPASAAPGLRWVEAAGEPDDRRKRLVAAAVAAYPGDASVAASLTSLSTAEGGFATIGFAGNDARVVAAGFQDGRSLRIVMLYASEVLKDHAAAEHLLARLADRARDSGLATLVVESARPVVRTVHAMFRIGFRATEASAGFRLGPIPQRTPPHVFAV